ncbi:MAG: serine/threonine protein phosphatase [Alphaproteobacteria bacterium]|nr:serine/threonine protein phosphatase [Alphaproteobacteria bacterium]
MTHPSEFFHPAPGFVPAGVRIYAIGDIHGRADLLARLLGKIADAAASAGSVLRQFIVFLGDYIDRGPLSREVVELILNSLPLGFERVTLKGNHEWLLSRFLEDSTIGTGWVNNGGLATLASYGLGGYQAAGAGAMDLETSERARRELVKIIPPRHRDFFAGLGTACRLGGYVFAHAGVRPLVPLDHQDERDLIWIREPFLSSRADFGAVVVHGHSVRLEPDLHHNRIGIDTGAYYTGRLTALMLEGRKLRFLQTGEA